MEQSDRNTRQETSASLTSTNTLGVVAFSQQTMNTAYGKREAGFGRTTKTKLSAMEAPKKWLLEPQKKLGLRCDTYEVNVANTGQKMVRGENSRLRVLAAAGLASRFTSSHFGGFG